MTAGESLSLHFLRAEFVRMRSEELVDTHALSAVNTFIRCLMICRDKNLIKTHTHKTRDTKLEVDKGKVILQW